MINLKNYQNDHVSKILKHVKSNNIFIDGSPMGSGKTITTNYIAKTLNLPLLVICPLSLKMMWRDTANKFGNVIIEILTYQSLRGEKLFTIEDRFRPYPSIKNKKYLLVFDEFHNLKNNSKQTRYAEILIKYSISNKCIVALLSATPLDKETQIYNFLRIMDITNSDYKLKSAKDTIEFSFGINKDKTMKIIKDDDVNLSPDIVALNLVKYVIIPKYLFCMNVESFEHSLDIKNGFYKISPEKMKELNKLYTKLASCLRFKENVNDKKIYATIKSKLIGAIQTLLLKIENIKAESIGRVAAEILNTKNIKLVIFLNFISSIEILKEILAQFNPLIFTGKIGVQQRKIILEKFQEDSMTHRLLICTSQIGGVGLNLDDTTGNFPRYLLISPSYHFMNIHQSIGRIYRTTTKSNGVVRLFYIKNLEAEMLILKSLARKSDLMKTVSCEQNKIEYLHELKNYVE